MDEVLISRCQAGDANAFGLLFEQYKNLVYKTAYLMTGTAIRETYNGQWGGRLRREPQHCWIDVNATDFEWQVEGASSRTNRRQDDREPGRRRLRRS